VSWRVAGFRLANNWLATARLAGDKNSVVVSVGSATDDPARPLVVRSTDGETVVHPTNPLRPLTTQPLPIRGRGAHIASADNTTGILTIAVASGKTIRYDGIRGRVVRP
jgi:hypothetical protein